MTGRIRYLETPHPAPKRAGRLPALGAAAAVVLLAASALIRVPAVEESVVPPMHNPDPSVIGPVRSTG